MQLWLKMQNDQAPAPCDDGGFDVPGVALTGIVHSPMSGFLFDFGGGGRLWRSDRSAGTFAPAIERRGRPVRSTPDGEERGHERGQARGRGPGRVDRHRAMG